MACPVDYHFPFLLSDSHYTIYIVLYPVFHHSSLTTMQITDNITYIELYDSKVSLISVQQTNGRCTYVAINSETCLGHPWASSN